MTLMPLIPFPSGPPAGQHQRLQHELPEALPRRPPHQAAAPGLHHPDPTLDLRAVLQGEVPTPPLRGPGRPCQGPQHSQAARCHNRSPFASGAGGTGVREEHQRHTAQLGCPAGSLVLTR